MFLYHQCHDDRGVIRIPSSHQRWSLKLERFQEFSRTLRPKTNPATPSWRLDSLGHCLLTPRDVQVNADLFLFLPFKRNDPLQLFAPKDDPKALALKETALVFQATEGSGTRMTLVHSFPTKNPFQSHLEKCRWSNTMSTCPLSVWTILHKNLRRKETLHIIGTSIALVVSNDPKLVSQFCHAVSLNAFLNLQNFISSLQLLHVTYCFSSWAQCVANGCIYQAHRSLLQLCCLSTRQGLAIKHVLSQKHHLYKLLCWFPSEGF